MKKAATLIILLLIFAATRAQNEFKWEEVDSVPKTKAQIYSDTKTFINEKLKVAAGAIQNDDKEGGVILVNGTNTQHTYLQTINVRWVYSYTLKFLMKEGRYKLIIENVHCDQNFWNDKTYNGCLPACDACEPPAWKVTGLNKTQSAQILASLKGDLQAIVDGYNKYIKSAANENSNW